MAEREARGAARVRVEHRRHLRERAALAQQPARRRLGQLVLRLQQSAPLVARPQHALLGAHQHAHAVQQQVAQRARRVVQREQPQVRQVQLDAVRPRRAAQRLGAAALLHPLHLGDALERGVAHQAAQQAHGEARHVRRLRALRRRLRRRRTALLAAGGGGGLPLTLDRLAARRRRRRVVVGVVQAAAAPQQRKQRPAHRPLALRRHLQRPPRQGRELEQLLQQAQAQAVRPAAAPPRRVGGGAVRRPSGTTTASAAASTAQPRQRASPLPSLAGGLGGGGTTQPGQGAAGGGDDDAVAVLLLHSPTVVVNLARRLADVVDVDRYRLPLAAVAAGASLRLRDAREEALTLAVAVGSIAVQRERRH